MTPMTLTLSNMLTLMWIMFLLAALCLGIIIGSILSLWAPDATIDEMEHLP